MTVGSSGSWRNYISMDMTVRQISEALGVSRQRIYRYIRANNPKYHYVGSGKTMYFAAPEVNKMKRAFMAEDSAGTDTEMSAGPDSGEDEIRRKVEELEKKLEEAGLEAQEKDRIIEDLNSQRSSLLSSLNKSTECIKELSAGMRNLTDSLKVAQVMQADSLRRLDDERKSRRLIGHETIIGEILAGIVGRFLRR